MLRWEPSHGLAYVARALGVLHSIWRVRRDVREPVIYGLILGALLLVRIVNQGRVPAASRGGVSCGDCSAGFAEVSA